HLHEQAYYGETAEDAQPEVAAARGIGARFARALPDPLGAIVQKEFALLRREPAVRSILVGQAIYPVFVFGGLAWKVIFEHDAPDRVRYAPLAGVVSYPLLLMELGLILN